MSHGSLSGYDSQAKVLADRYDSLDFSKIHGWLLHLLPETRGSALDVGAGSGRDAKGLLKLGYDVVAVEPSTQMRQEGIKRHPDHGILWIDESLPGLDSLVRQGLSFDLILLSAVWMHVSPDDRPRAFRKLVSLLKPAGILAITLRQGPSDTDRPMFDTSLDELERLAKAHGISVLHSGSEADHLGRSNIIWHHMAMKFPDDETGALPLFRHVILKSDKSSTYKLGLLRAIARIADGSQGMSRICSDDTISIPLGLVGLYWIRLYKPLISANLPQNPQNIGTKGLGFIGKSWDRLNLSPLDLRPGMRFSGEDAFALHQSIRDAVESITKMPAHYMTFPGTKNPIFEAKKSRNRIYSDILLDENYLRSFGEMIVPLHLWKALSRYDAWIDPALQSEWIRLMEGYLEGRETETDLRVMIEAMKWSEPKRDVSTVKEIARRFLSKNTLYCIWSGKRLTEKTLDIDHCFPWAAWPCDDLWNLFPTNGTVNKNKSDKIPSSKVLLQSSERMIEWWHSAFLTNGNDPIRRRFYVEAQGTLVTNSLQRTDSQPLELPLEEIFNALSLKRVSLKTDQGLEEWDGGKYSEL
jgi:SAM-dependent methyltransferase